MHLFTRCGYHRSTSVPRPEPDKSGRFGGRGELRGSVSVPVDPDVFTSFFSGLVGRDRDMSTTTTTTLAGLVMVVGAALAYTRFGIKEGDTRVDVDEDEGVEKDGEKDVGERGEAKDGARKGRQRRKAKGGVGDDDKGNAKGEDKGREKAKARGDVDAATAVPGIPGDFDAVGSATGAGTGSQDAAASPAGTGKTEGKKRRKKKKGSRAHQGKAPDGHGEGDGHKAGDEEGGEDDGSETDKEVQASGRTVPRALRSGDSTDADAPLSLSRSPSASASVLRGPRAVGKGNPGAPMGTRLAIPPSQPRAIRPSLSFDTDSSWTHVDPRRFKTHMSGDAMEVASSDLASTESSSPVAERTEGVADDIRGTRADLAQRTLAEKLVPRPEATGVDEYVFLSVFSLFFFFWSGLSFTTGFIFIWISFGFLAFSWMVWVLILNSFFFSLCLLACWNSPMSPP